MMRAVVIARPGGPEVLEMVRRPVPAPEPGHVLVRAAASGLNRADLLQRRGGYSAPPGAPQDVPGMEISGTVEEAGAGVTRWRPGDRVMGIVAGGAYAELVPCHEGSLLPVPGRLDPVEAGAVPEVFLTAYDAAFARCGLDAGETLLVHAVGSGVGTAALQLGVAFGARVLGTSRTAEKLRAARALGLTEPVLADDSWAERVLEATGGRGVDVIVDLVGAPYLAGNQRVLGPGGRHVVVGVPGGAEAVIDLRALMSRRGSLYGTLLRPRSLAEKAELVADFARRALPLFDAGALRPVVDSVYAAEDAAEAHRRMEANLNFGKILLTW